jgi:hypothetical protein
MGRKTLRAKKRSFSQITPGKKGRIVEQIVANFHNWPNVKVEHNVFLPVIGNSRRKREIDVLLTANLAGYPVQIAFECKNEKNPIGSPKIDAFIGKLYDIGISPQHGIYVSASGYVPNAIERAKKEGIRPLVLQGLTKEGLRTSVAEAFQSIIFLLAEIECISITNNIPVLTNPEEMEIFYNEERKICGSISNILWQKWVNGEIPSSIGQHIVKVSIPSNWYQIISGKVERPQAIALTIRVIGLVIDLTGQVEKYSLLNASNNRVEKDHFNVLFNIPKGEYPVTNIYTESQLEEFLRKPVAVKVTTRVRLPRIKNGPIYWPPSERAVNKIIELMKAFESGQIPDPRPFDITEIEGTDLQTIWEPFLERKQEKKL